MWRKSTPTVTKFSRILIIIVFFDMIIEQLNKRLFVRKESYSDSIAYLFAVTRDFRLSQFFLDDARIFYYVLVLMPVFVLLYLQLTTFL